MADNWLILDIATAPLPNAADFMDADDITAPANYKSADAIARYQADERQKRLDRAGLDLDLARITCVGTRAEGANQFAVVLCENETTEALAIGGLALSLQEYQPRLITYNGHSFDLLLLQRRARYLGVDFPVINTDRYKSPHVDLMDVLSHRGLVARKSLAWYCKRLAWTDLVKPLSGAQEAQVPVSGRWDELRQSVQHDVTATERLARWLGVIAKEPTL